MNLSKCTLIHTLHRIDRHDEVVCSTKNVKYVLLMLMFLEWGFKINAIELFLFLIANASSCFRLICIIVLRTLIMYVIARILWENGLNNYRITSTLGPPRL